MKPAADLITALAALLSAIAWPVVFFVVAVMFRGPLKELIARIRKGKVGSFLDFELEQLAVSSTSKTVEASGEITAEQIQSSARIEARSQDVGQDQLLHEMERLCIEYERIRNTMAPGGLRTEAMTRVLVQMRALGPALSGKVDVFKTATSPGRRLAAIAVMQMRPETADLDWLAARFGQEAPFVFYHAAIALRNAWLVAVGADKDRAREAASEALARLKSYKGGQPDANSLNILESIVPPHW